jgi:hypothetical protein
MNSALTYRKNHLKKLPNPRGCDRGAQESSIIPSPLRGEGRVRGGSKKDGTALTYLALAGFIL